MKKKTVCWKSVVCQYDNYRKDPLDKYNGDIFGYLSNFESPHWLFRRFHRNFCKALIMSSLRDYEMKIESDYLSDKLLLQACDIRNEFYSIEQLAYHNSLILMVSAVEIFLKDSFKIILQYIYSEKIRNSSCEKIIRSYSFQNVESIKKAYKWLIPDFDDVKIFHIIDPNDFHKTVDISKMVISMLERRHKIVHESYFFSDFDQRLFSFYSSLCFEWASSFNYYFEDNDFYNKIDEKYGEIKEI